MKQVNSKVLIKQLQSQCNDSRRPRGKETPLMDTRRADHFWVMMLGMYADKWVNKNGSIPSEMWTQAIATLTDQQINFGVDKCREKIFSGDPWAPDLADFLAMIHSNSEIDFHAAFLRCLRNAEDGRVEKWVCENIGFNIRAISNDSASILHKKWMLTAIEKERKGELILNSEMAPALPPKSVKNLNDLTREAFDRENGGKLDPRVERIRKAQRLSKPRINLGEK